MIDENKRVAVFEKSDGECGYCEKELSFGNRSRQGRGAWEVEHRVPRAKGGTDHLNNLVAACWPCNVTKGVGSARTHAQSVVAEKAARTSRRLWATAGKALIPAIVVGGAAYAYLRWTGPSEDEKQVMTPEEKNQFWWKMLLIPVGVGVATLALIVFVNEATRKA
jgi:hypothetical protein